MKVYLLSAGNAPRDALSTILSAHACGAAPAVSGFEILHLSPNASGIRDLEGFAGDLSLCGSAFAGEDAFPLAGFSCRVRLMAPELPSAADLSADPASGLLLSALRGKGVPLSYRADREAVSWAIAEELYPGREEGRIGATQTTTRADCAYLISAYRKGNTK